MVGYEVKIIECSKETSAKEKVLLKDTTNCVKLDKATQSGEVIIDLDYFAILSVHNEKSEDKDYTQYIIVDKDGTKYVTGSESFYSSFSNIYAEMLGVEEEWSIKAYRMPSKNREGKDFITCSII